MKKLFLNCVRVSLRLLVSNIDINRFIFSLFNNTISHELKIQCIQLLYNVYESLREI